MGFLSFNEQYYIKELARLEGKKLDQKGIYETKQILKLLDDLADEGYFELNNDLESKYHVITRLRSILSLHGEKPFRLLHAQIPAVNYSENEFEVTGLCNALIGTASEERVISDNPFIEEIAAYCDWLGSEWDTAYIFLFRDAFLPYVYFRSRDRDRLYPWLISRAFLSDVSGKENIDDEIRLPIYEALESGITEYSAFKEFCKERIHKVLEQYPPLAQALGGLLKEIREKRIMVVETGYCGTVPMLLASLDDRVDFRLYTTAPFLYEVYRDKIFCRKYENIRLFETLYSQDILMKYASFTHGKFYVRLALEANVRDNAIKEIYSLISRERAFPGHM